MCEVVKNSWSALDYIKDPTDKVIKNAIENSGWAIQYVKNPSEELQLMAVKKNYDSIKYIENPSEKIQLEAININYDALRYIKNPTLNVEIEAIKKDERAINFIDDINDEKLMEFLKQNILVVKYIYKKIGVDNIKNAIKEAISKEDIDEKYIRDFLNCSIIDRNSKEINLDKIMFIYKYGSKKAKQIAVDEKLKMM